MSVTTYITHYFHTGDDGETRGERLFQFRASLDITVGPNCLGASVLPPFPFLDPSSFPWLNSTQPAKSWKTDLKFGCSPFWHSWFHLGKALPDGAYLLLPFLAQINIATGTSNPKLFQEYQTKPASLSLSLRQLNSEHWRLD